MARLGDVCICITDGSHNPPQGLEHSDYCMLSSKNIDDDRITLESPRYLSLADFDLENRRTRIVPGDLLMTIVGTVGRVAIVPESMSPFCVQRSVAVIKSKSDVIFNRFLMYQLQSMRPYLENESRGVAQKGIYLKQISNLPITVPAMTEQKYITTVLDKVSNLIFLRKQQLDRLDELVKARFVEMFGNLSSNSMHWTFKPLAELCDVRDGTHDSPKYHLNGYPLLTSKNFTNRMVDFTNANLISKEDFDAINQRSKVDYGDIVMPMIGTIGHPVIVDTYQPFAIKNVALIKFRDNEISNVFIKEILDSDYFKAVIQEKNRGNTQKFIALGDIRKIMIPLVSYELQSKFSNFVSKTSSQRLTIQQGLDKLEVLKKALMQEYFG